MPLAVEAQSLSPAGSRAGADEKNIPKAVVSLMPFAWHHFLTTGKSFNNACLLTDRKDTSPFSNVLDDSTPNVQHVGVFSSCHNASLYPVSVSKSFHL